ncbi:exosome complex protein Rrp42 [Candidatus Woesearchaeota archaeon]|nr:exosome complex protein Rrp42 [Candidatus Woesearchaeota archaeon]
MEQKNHMLKYLQKGIRFDGRKLDQYRLINVEYGVSNSAEGSAIVNVGDTKIIVGVKLAVEKPFLDTADCGNLMVNAELTPMSSPDFEPGPPTETGIELARIVDRGIRESHAIDVHKLCIKEGEKVWSVAIDVCTLNAAGNLIDAAALGALAALKDARYPAYDLEKNAIDYGEKTDKKLPLECQPIAVTVWKIGDYLLVDPLPQEENAADARLTVTTIADGSVASLQKGGDCPLSVEEVDSMVGLAIEKAKELRKALG